MKSPLILSTALVLLLSGCDQQEAKPEASSEAPKPATEAAKKERIPEPAQEPALAKKAEKPAQETKPTTASFAEQSSNAESLPDFTQYKDVKEKKAAFFGFIRRQIKIAYTEIDQERAMIEKWDGSSAASSKIAELIEKYRVDASTPVEQKAELLDRVQHIPTSLVLAQAANESAWGTSRFARKGNNLFGQWCFSKGCGIVPNQRNDGAAHEVAKFDAPLDSVRSYMRNLNSHPTYQLLRDLRKKEIAKQGYSTGVNLAAGLINYSERREEYVKELRSMITYNKLDQYDQPE